jgi:hypothetical protein
VFGQLANRVRRRPVAVRPRAVLRIAYQPKRDGDADPGEVVWTWIPFEEDPRQGKDRPALVIGWIGVQAALLPMTSKDHTDHDDCIELGPGSWDRDGRVSYVRLDRLLKVPPKKIRREGAVLDKARFDEVVERFRAYHRVHG